MNANRYLLKRDIARTLPKCLDDLLAALTDQRKTLTVHHNRTETEIPLDQIRICMEGSFLPQKAPLAVRGAKVTIRGIYRRGQRKR